MRHLKRSHILVTGILWTAAALLPTAAKADNVA